MSASFAEQHTAGGFPARTALYALTPRGLAAAQRISAHIHVDLFISKTLAGLPQPPGCRVMPGLARQLARTFHAYPCHIFIAAAGIVVRLVAPLLKGKDADPAVLVMDQDGQFVISLLSGHLGGANDYARRLASLCGAVPVITTATDTAGFPAIDCLARNAGLRIAGLQGIKQVNSAILRSIPVLVHDPGGFLQLDRQVGQMGKMRQTRQTEQTQQTDAFADISADVPADASADVSTDSPSWWMPFAGDGSAETALEASASQDDISPLVWVSERTDVPVTGRHTLVLHPPVVCIGVGCKKNTPAQAILDAVHQALSRRRLAPGAVCCLASIDAKAEEPGLVQAAQSLGVPLQVYSVEELNSYPASQPSPRAQAVFGVTAVCEPAALAAAGPNGVLLEKKHKAGSVTIALAQKRNN